MIMFLCLVSFCLLFCDKLERSSSLLSVLRTSWSSSKPGMLWLCCVGLRCPVLCGVAPFGIRQPLNLTSYFQKEEWTSCFKLILSVALICDVKHAACSWFTQLEMCIYVSALFRVCVLLWLFVHLGLCQNIPVFPNMSCFRGNCLTKKKLVQLLFWPLDWVGCSWFTRDTVGCEV